MKTDSPSIAAQPFTFFHHERGLFEPGINHSEDDSGDVKVAPEGHAKQPSSAQNMVGQSPATQEALQQVSIVALMDSIDEKILRIFNRASPPADDQVLPMNDELAKLSLQHSGRRIKLSSFSLRAPCRR